MGKSELMSDAALQDFFKTGVKIEINNTPVGHKVLINGEQEYTGDSYDDALDFVNRTLKANQKQYDVTATKKVADYNGYTNYETWTVALDIDNNPAKQDAAIALVKNFKAADADAVKEGLWTEDEALKLHVAKELQAAFEAEKPEVPSPYSELINGAVENIDWMEIASSVIETAQDS